MAVGDNQGNVYTGREGVDKAFLLTPRENLQGPLNKLLNQEAGNNKPKATPKDLEKRLEKGEKDLFYRHHAQLQGEMDNITDYFDELVRSGLDPFSDTGIESQEFRNALNDLEKKFNYSNQIKELYADDKKLYQTHGLKMDDASRDETFGWYDTHDINEAIASGDLPPILKWSQPEFDLEKAAKETASGISNDITSLDPDQQMVQYGTIAKGMLANAELSSEADQVVAGLSDAGKKELEAKAKQYGLTGKEYLMADLVMAHKATKPLDFEKWANENMPALDLNYGQYEENDKTTMSSVNELSIEKAKNAANTSLEVKPSLMKSLIGKTYTIYEKESGKQPKAIGEGKVTDKETATEMIAMYWVNQAGMEVKDQVSYDEAGYNRFGFGSYDEFKKDKDMWWEFLNYNVEEFDGKPLTDQQRLTGQKAAIAYAAGNELTPALPGWKIVDYGAERVGDLDKGGAIEYYDMKGNLIKGYSIDKMADTGKIYIPLAKEVSVEGKTKGSSNKETKFRIVVADIGSQELLSSEAFQQYNYGIETTEVPFQETYRLQINNDRSGGGLSRSKAVINENMIEQVKIDEAEIVPKGSGQVAEEMLTGKGLNPFTFEDKNVGNNSGSNNSGHAVDQWDRLD